MSRLLIAVLLAVASLSACGLRIPGITPYRIEIQQGNYVSQEMVSQLKAGMSKEQVRLTLGTPLLADAFHADRWDYVYWHEASNGKRESRKLTVFFTDGKLIRADGDLIPTQAPPAALKPTPTVISPAPPGAPGAAQSTPAGPEAPATRSPLPPVQPPPAQETR